MHVSVSAHTLSYKAENCPFKFCEETFEILMDIVLNLWITFSRLVIFTLLILFVSVGDLEMDDS